MSVVENDRHERTAWTRYMAYMADACELRDWSIKAADSDPPEDDDGFILTTYGRKRARIGVRQGLSPEDTRHILVHELLHCHVDLFSEIVESELGEFVGQPAAQAFKAGYKRNMEHAVDAIATALAKHLPLPSPAAMKR